MATRPERPSELSAARGNVEDVAFVLEFCEYAQYRELTGELWIDNKKGSFSLKLWGAEVVQVNGVKIKGFKAKFAEADTCEKYLNGIVCSEKETYRETLQRIDGLNEILGNMRFESVFNAFKKIDSCLCCPLKHS